MSTSAEKRASKAGYTGRQSLSPLKRDRLEKLFAHATAKSLNPKDADYVAGMLAQCVIGDPGNTEYIHAFLENLQNKYGNNKKGCQFAQFKKLGARAALKKALTQEQWDEAIKHGLEVLTANPWDIAALVGMAAAAKQSGDLRSELLYLKTAAIGSPRDPACNRLLAKALRERGLIDQAIEFWHRVEEVLPEDAEAEKAIADLTIEKATSRGDFDVPDEEDAVAKKIRFNAEQREAIARKENLQQKIDEEPENLEHYLALAQISLSEERYADAEEILCRAYGISENDPDILDRLDDVRLRHLRQQISLAEDLEVKKKLRKEYFSKDLEVCSRRVQRYPNHLRFRFDLGYRYMMAKRYTEAIKELQIARKDSARTGLAMLALGQCFQQLKHYTLARDHYETAIREISDRDTENRKQALYLCGRLALAMKDIDTAEKHLTTLGCLDFNYKDSEALLEKIGKLRESSGNATPANQS